jgi:hypothetical protein
VTALISLYLVSTVAGPCAACGRGRVRRTSELSEFGLRHRPTRSHLAGAPGHDERAHSRLDAIESFAATCPTSEEPAHIAARAVATAIKQEEDGTARDIIVTTCGGWTGSSPAFRCLKADELARETVPEHGEPLGTL